MQESDYDGAIADYTQALQINPKIAAAYYHRGLAQQAKNDLDSAVGDYGRAIQLDPTIALAYYNRGLLEEQRDHLDLAVSDYNQALELDPKNFQAYYNRGVAKQAMGNLDGALADLELFCQSDAKNNYVDYAHLYLWIIRTRQEQRTTANQDLSDALSKNWNALSDDLASKLAFFLLGQINENDLIAAAESPDLKRDQGQHCEVWYFAGVKRLLSGDKNTAIDYFRKCLGTGEKDYCEYILAKAELRTLGITPDTPP
jgi:lipoprotein NlpI